MDEQTKEQAKRTLWKMIRRPLRMGAGVALVLVGLAGLILPILPGWVFLVPGITILFPGSRVARWIRAKWRQVRQARRKRSQPPGEPDGRTPSVPPAGDKTKTPG